MSDTDDADEFDSDAIPVPFFDEKTGKKYVLMLTQAQADCLLQQDVQGVTDVETALTACNIDRRVLND